ncbi:MAG: 4Fe-4S dicluster domain-containing protein [Chloroflexi bacterium]|nr:4Fe-4S dicluster domain-containing protein [Chloroflexota bacterium]
MPKAKGEIVITKEEQCTGCAFCQTYCNHGCIEIGPKFNLEGYLVARFANPENCNACMVCAWMCPRALIEVYKYEEAAS